MYIHNVTSYVSRCVLSKIPDSDIARYGQLLPHNLYGINIVQCVIKSGIL